MSFNLDNSRDIICDSLFLLDTNDILQNVLDLINAGGGGGSGSSGITPLTGSGAAVITGTSTSKNILVDLSMYSTITQINTLLAGEVDNSQVLTNVPVNSVFTNTLYVKPANEQISCITGLQTSFNAKQNTLSAGSNITITGNTIASTGVSPLILQVDGVAQNATTLNFIQDNALLSGGVLNASRLTHYDKIPLIFSGIASTKDLYQSSNGNLSWGTEILTTNTYLGSVLASYTNTAGINTLLSGYINTTALNTLLNAKQATLTAGNNITISNNSISATSGGNPLSVQLHGINQIATTLNFVENNAVLSNGVLNVSRLTYYDKVPLIYSGVSFIKNIELYHFGNLLFGTDIAATHNYLTSVLASYVTTTALSAYTTTAAMTTLLNGKVDDGQVLTNVPANAVFTDTLYTHPTAHPISMITGLQTAFNAKQDNLVAGGNITISGNTISATSGGSGSSLTLQVNGVTQTATTLNFIENDAVLSGGVLNVSRSIIMTKYHQFIQHKQQLKI
jgi:hypothetical protein